VFNFLETHSFTGLFQESVKSTDFTVKPFSDALISLDLQDSNFGSEEWADLYENTALLLKFDIGAIPNNAVIDDAYLTLTNYEFYNSHDVTVIVYQLDTTAWLEDKVTWRKTDGENAWKDRKKFDYKDYSDVFASNGALIDGANLENYFVFNGAGINYIQNSLEKSSVDFVVRCTNCGTEKSRGFWTKEALKDRRPQLRVSYH
jgi:hypothetical protein